MYICDHCERFFCLDCDLFIHETLHSCPGCASSRQTQQSAQMAGFSWQRWKIKNEFYKEKTTLSWFFLITYLFCFFYNKYYRNILQDITFSKKKESKRNKLRISENCGRSACPCIPVKIQNTITIRSVLYLCTRYCNWWEWWVPF